MELIPRLPGAATPFHNDPICGSRRNLLDLVTPVVLAFGGVFRLALQFLLSSEQGGERLGRRARTTSLSGRGSNDSEGDRLSRHDDHESRSAEVNQGVTF